VTAVASAVIALLLACGGVVFVLTRTLSSGFSTMSELRTIAEEDYPGYRIIDSTRQGFILQHETMEALRIDVRYFTPEQEGDWPDQPLEALPSGWMTNDSFFRHANGRSPDPRTGMTYDVAGFVEAYDSLRPGPNAVVMGVWLDESVPEDDFEIYYVLVARRNRGEAIWPDHFSVFSRLTEFGDWDGESFQPVGSEPAGGG